MKPFPEIAKLVEKFTDLESTAQTPEEMRKVRRLRNMAEVLGKAMESLGEPKAKSKAKKATGAKKAQAKAPAKPKARPKPRKTKAKK